MLKNNIEVLYDDRDAVSAGEKFAEADLLGIPWRAVVSERSLKSLPGQGGGGIELKRRTEDKAKIVSTNEFLNLLKS